ncbi:MAG TPA: ATP-grasp domain-containing protein [Pseudonocardiaceae bacterium]|jgi:biotin carboxylase|nr:ATP-grasp domain-containing protein [Pseudonocardiaceae bacterium]
MPAHLCLVALNPTDSVTDGFLPAAAALGLRVTLLTSQPDAHHRAYAGHATPPAEIVDCDVRDFRAVIDNIDPSADAVFSNSDHLQTQTALAAAYFGRPAKDWRAALRVKNKAQMRRHLAHHGVDVVWSRELRSGDIASDAPFPCVLKPREGVASEDVVLVADRRELDLACQDVWRRKPDLPLVLEEFLDGELHSLETLGDGHLPRVLGGFATTLSPPPYFVERAMVYDPAPSAGDVRTVLAQLAALGVGFGACHTEYVVAGDRVRLIEVNYRIIGDQCDLLLADLTGLPLFEYVLRVHLGEPLPAALPAHRDRSARIDWPCADRGGRLMSAPAATERCADGVSLVYRPLRAIGDERPLTNTNRDYLGVLRATGRDQAPVDSASAAFLAELRWDIQP